MGEYHRLLTEAIFWKELRRRDEERGAELQAGGCQREGCGGKLDRADYPRAPRGHGIEFTANDTRRVSYCCRRCRRRHTPVSERFLAYKVYSFIAVIVTITLTSRGLAEVTFRQICGLSGASEVTVRRWRRWILEFLASPEWKLLRTRLSAVFEAIRFPASLVEQFRKAGRTLRAGIVATVKFLNILSRTKLQNTLVVDVERNLAVCREKMMADCICAEVVR